MEIWKDIPDYEGNYQVSNEGKIKSLERKVNGEFGLRRVKELILSPILQKENYLSVCLYKDGISKQHRVHRLVAKVFMSNPLNKPEINHLDNDTTNNKVSNLEWTDRIGNIEHCVKQGRNSRGEVNGMSKLSEQDVIMIRDRIANKEISQNKLAKELGVRQTNISSIVNRKTWKYI